MDFAAAVLHRVGSALTIETVEVGDLGPGDVLVRLRASGLCHTDLEVIQGTLHQPLPAVLGHEGAGVVEAVGEGVTLVSPGQNVVCSWAPNCGHCFYCVRGDSILCEPLAQGNSSGTLLDGTSRLSLRGETLHHFMLVSAYAELCVLPEAGVIPVPEEVPFDRACLLGCGVMTGVGAAINVARVTIGSTVLVVGCGAVGLNVIQGARLLRAASIIAVDLDDRKLEQARQFGANETINAKHEDSLEAVLSVTDGRGADFSFEAAGNERAMRLAFEGARRGAKVVILGKTAFDAEVSFRFGSLMGEKQIIRSAYGGARPRRDFPALAQSYLNGELMLDELITNRLPLTRIMEGFESMERSGSIRTVLTFED